MLAILVVVYSLMKRGREERGRGHDVPLECIAIQLLVEKYVHVSVSLLVCNLVLLICWLMLLIVFVTLHVLRSVAGLFGNFNPVCISLLTYQEYSPGQHF